MHKSKITVDGKAVKDGTNHGARPFLDIDIFAIPEKLGSWSGYMNQYPPQDGSIRNVEVITPLPVPASFTEEDCNMPDSGLFWDGSKCAECGLFCYECTDAGTCTKCFYGLPIVDGQCQTRKYLDHSVDK